MGTRLGLAALEAVADRFSREVRVVPEQEGSVTPITRYHRRFEEPAEPPALAAARELVSIPLMPHPPSRRSSACAGSTTTTSSRRAPPVSGAA